MRRLAWWLRLVVAEAHERRLTVLADEDPLRWEPHRRLAEWQRRYIENNPPEAR